MNNNRNSAGVKWSTDQYRAGGERSLWEDRYDMTTTLQIVADLRGAGFKVWRTGNQVWVLASEIDAIAASGKGRE